MVTKVTFVGDGFTRKVCSYASTLSFFWQH